MSVKRGLAPSSGVVTKKRGSSAAPAARHRPTDTKIRAWHADDPKPPPSSLRPFVKAMRHG